MQLIVITTEGLFNEEVLILNKLFERGMSRLHLRKPSANEEELGNLLLQIKTEYYERIVLHDHFSLLQSFPLSGVHLNRRNPFPPTAKQLSVSCSCHSFGEVLHLAGNYDYLFLSPIFDSISKLGYKQAFTAEELTTARSEGLINSNVIALGGVNEQTLPLAAKYGFGGVAVLGALWSKYMKDKNETALIKQFEVLSTLAKNR
jgi:thiamine-phosphate pyrophosphorylase